MQSQESRSGGGRRTAGGAVALLIVLLGAALVAGCGGASDTEDGAGGDGADIAFGGDPSDAGGGAPGDTGGGPDGAAAPVDIAGPDGEAPPDSAAPDTTSPGVDIPPPPGDAVGPRPACEPCGYADVRGRVCAPDEQTYVSGAMVWVETVGCDGQPVRVEALSDPRGYYLLEGVPCGEQTIHIERGSYAHDFGVTVRAGELNDITGAGFKLCFGARAARIAVITGDWDNIEDLIRRMGFDADIYELYSDADPDYGGDVLYSPAYNLLHDLDALQAYDILLVDCGAGHYDLAGSGPTVDFNIRRFVEGGGSLYMSDFAYIYSERVWPGAIDFWGNNETAGTMGASDGPIVMQSEELVGIILDPDLKAYLGNPASIPISLGLSPLVSVEGAPATTNMHVVAQIPQFDDTNQPLILSYRPTNDSGWVIYTTFHNTEQHIDEMQQVLTYLMFVL